MKRQRKVAIVTGSGRGIGRAIAARMVREGIAVVIAEIDRKTGTATARELGRTGTALFAQTDVADEASVRRMIARTMARLGRVDFLVNNAAAMDGGQAVDLPVEKWRRVIGVNLTGAFLCARCAAPHFPRKGGGAIVNIASTRALMSEPNTEAYSASKGGLLGLTHSLAISLGPRVRVNAVCPGWIDTRASRPGRHGPVPPLRVADHTQHPAGRVGTPEDIAEMVLFLCSERSGFITGQNFVVDGGMTKKMIYIE